MSHPIEAIMETTMENLRRMVDVGTVVGDAVQTADGCTIIPVSKVSFGFAAGGGEGEMEPDISSAQAEPGQNAFVGGAGAGVSISPVGFLIVSGSQVKLLPAQHVGFLDRLVDLTPVLLEDVKRLFGDEADDDELPATGEYPKDSM